MKFVSCGFVLLLGWMNSPAYAQAPLVRISFEKVAVLMRSSSPAELVDRHLRPYCFDRLDATREATLTSAARMRDATADPARVLEYIRSHTCESLRPVLTPEPDRGDRGRETPRPPAPTVPRPAPAPVPAPVPELREDAPIVSEGRCVRVAAEGADTRRDLRIPRYIRYLYVFLQTPGPVETADSERLASALEKDEFVKCFEAFRDLARSRGMRLIVTATDAGHEGWHQPKIVYRGANLRVTDYKAPGEARTYPGAEIPVN